MTLRIRAYRSLAAVSALAVGITSSALAQVSVRDAARESLPAGSVLKVRLDQRLNSAEARPGQRFTATVRSDEDGSGLPPGTRVEGVVRAARPASKTQPGVLDVDFTALRFPDNRSYAVNGSLTALDKDSVTRTADGRLVSKRDTKSQKMKFLGYGAGVGALIGALAGENLLKGALLGAAGGYLYGQLNKDKNQGRYVNVDLKEGSEFGVRLDQRFAYVPVSNYRRDSGFGDPVGRRGQIGGANGNGRFGYPNGTARGRLDDQPGNGTIRGRLEDQPGNGNVRRQGTGIGVLVGDREVNFANARPLRVGQSVLVPLAAVMNASGIRYQYNSAAREVTVQGPEGDARLTVGSTVAWVNGRREPIGAPARIINGSLYVPDRFVSLATGMRADWDEGTQTLIFTDRDNRGQDLDRGL